MEKNGSRLLDKLLDKNIQTLNLSKNIKNILIQNEVDTVLKLCNYSRIELTDIGLSNLDINDIMIALQLAGLDLKKNHSKRNTILDKYK